MNGIESIQNLSNAEPLIKKWVLENPEMRLSTIFKLLRKRSEFSLIGDYPILRFTLNIISKESQEKAPFVRITRGNLRSAIRLCDFYVKGDRYTDEFDDYVNSISEPTEEQIARGKALSRR